MCDKEHVTEKLFLSFQAAEGVEQIDCLTCGEVADKLLSTPFPAHLHGNPEGYHKPSPQKRFSYRKMTSRGNGDTPGRD